MRNSMAARYRAANPRHPRVNVFESPIVKMIEGMMGSVAAPITTPTPAPPPKKAKKPTVAELQKKLEVAEERIVALEEAVKKLLEEK